MGVELHAGDCLDVLAGLPAESVDSVVTDPPYHFGTIVKRFGSDKSSMEQPANKDLSGVNAGAFRRLAKGFMGKKWDGGDVAFRPETWAAVARVLKPGGHLLAFGAPKNAHRLFCAIEDAGFEIRDCVMWVFGTGFPKSHNLDGDWKGWGTALKPAYEPIVVARKPLIGTVAENVLAHGTGALNIDGCRVEGAKPDTTRGAGGQHGAYSPLGAQGRIVDDGRGRWPANLVHDGSEDVLAAFPEAPGQQRKVGPEHGAKPSVNTYGDFGPREDFEPRGDSGSAARFFYSAKAGKKDRAGSKHPTVKPVALMRWLVRLVTPPSGTVLDPFAGSGTTGQAAIEEGFNAILIEREAEYLADIRRRLNLDDPLAGWPDDLKDLVA